jgi:hypothetical protein
MAVDYDHRDAILNAQASPAHSVSALLRPLQGAGRFCDHALGILGSHVTFGQRDPSQPQSEPLANSDDFYVRWAQLVSVVLELSMINTMMAESIGWCISQCPEAEREAAWTQVCVDFEENLTESMAQLGIGSLTRDMEDVPTVRSRFMALMGNLPPASEQIGDQPWPSFDSVKETQVPVEGVPPPIRPLVSQKLSISYALLPLWGRVLALKHYGVLAGNLQVVARYLRAIFPADSSTVFLRIGPLVSQYYTPPTCQDGGESNAFRQIHRALTHAALLVAQAKALQEVVNGFDKPGLQLPYVPRYPSGTDSALPANALTHQLQHFPHVATGQWILCQPGGAPARPPGLSLPQSGTNPAMGMHFLNNQLKDKESKYRMPDKGAPQRQWEDWFSRVSALPRLYSGLSAQLVIPALLGHISTDDGRILGWQEISQEANASSKSVSLEMFLGHIRKQVLPVGTSRKAAAHQLDKITKKPLALSDCQALCIKLQQLFRQLYPINSDEVEPVTRLHAMRSVHVMLDAIKHVTPGTKSKLASAWLEYTAYNHSAMFYSYLKEDLHESAEKSTKLCSEYLQDVCKHLQDAHLMQVQLSQFQSVRDSSGEKSHSALSTKISKKRELDSGAERRSREDTKATVAAYGERTRTPSSKASKSSKKRTAAAGPVPASTSHAPRFQPRGRSPGSQSRPQYQSGQRQGAGGGRDSVRIQAALDACQQYFRNAPHLQPGNIRHTLDDNLLPLSGAQVLQEIERGACSLCQIHGHSIKECPAFGASSGELRDACRQYKTQYFTALHGV